MTALGVVTLAIWAWLLTARDGFWRARERDDAPLPPPATWPSVIAIVPARDEAGVIARAVASLAAQDYPGALRIVVVDDDSRDGTTAIVTALASPRVTLMRGAPLAPGWTGKLWAIEQGLAAAQADAPAYWWLTDADIAHAPDTLRHLVARAATGRVLVSTMARLRCQSPAERALIPAFVFFFQLLYPFAAVNRPGPAAAAAGGCVLVERVAFARAGGVAAIRRALIDDCALGALMKRHGPIWLGLTRRSVSLRAYTLAAIADMIARSAYAQLGYSPLRLAGAIVGLALTFLAPPLLALLASGPAQLCGMGAWALMTFALQPMLAFYRRSPLWGAALPAIAAFYAACTLLSAWWHALGRGGLWKGRAQAALR